ncbi:hypothetical protein [Methanochimaera problematica]|nr:hypothetical protein [Methanoplanus sp. FWC-SCC4]
MLFAGPVMALESGVMVNSDKEIVAKGDKITISGSAPGSDDVSFWLFGPDYQTRMTLHPEMDTEFSWEFIPDGANDTFIFTPDESRMIVISPNDRSYTLQSGQYYFILQTKGDDKKFDIKSTYSGGILEIISLKDNRSKLMTYCAGCPAGSEAADALIGLLDAPEVDDQYAKLSFLVEEPWARINEIPDISTGDALKITGTTNLAPGNEFIIQILSSSNTPDKSQEEQQTGELKRVSDVVSVIEGKQYNTWSYEADISTFVPGKYLIVINRDGYDSHLAWSTFDIVPNIETTETSGVTEPTQSGITPLPFFGALILLSIVLTGRRE